MHFQVICKREANYECLNGPTVLSLVDHEGMSLGRMKMQRNASALVTCREDNSLQSELTPKRRTLYEDADYLEGISRYRY